MNEGIVEGGEDTSNTENELAYTSLVSATGSPSSKSHNFSKFRRGTKNRTIRGEGSEVDVLTGLAGLLLGRGHFRSAGWTCMCGRNTGREKKEKKRKPQYPVSTPISRLRAAMRCQLPDWEGVDIMIM